MLYYPATHNYKHSHTPMQWIIDCSVSLPAVYLSIVVVACSNYYAATQGSLLLTKAVRGVRVVNEQPIIEIVLEIALLNNFIDNTLQGKRTN